MQHFKWLFVLPVLCAFVMPGTQAAAADIVRTGYRLTFRDEFNTISVTDQTPKGAATWYYQPPYPSGGEFSLSRWDENELYVENGILKVRAGVVMQDSAPGNKTWVGLDMKTGTGASVITKLAPGSKRSDAM